MRYVVVRRQRVNQQDDSDVSNYTRSKVGGGQKNLRKEMTRNSANLNFVKCPSTTVVNYKMQTFLCWGIPLREIVFMLRNASKRERFYVEKSLQERAFLCWGMPPRESVFMLRNASKRERFISPPHVKAHNLPCTIYWVRPQPHTPISRSGL